MNHLDNWFNHHIGSCVQYIIVIVCWEQSRLVKHYLKPYMNIIYTIMIKWLLIIFIPLCIEVYMMLMWILLRIFKVCYSVIWPTHSIFNYGHIVKLYSHFVYSPLNSYAYIHWILDFKYILLLLYVAINHVSWQYKINIIISETISLYILLSGHISSNLCPHISTELVFYIWWILDIKYILLLLYIVGLHDLRFGCKL